MRACVADVRFTPKAATAPTARAVHQVKATTTPPPHPQTLSPPFPAPLNSRRPFQTLRRADVRWRTVRSGPAQQERGRKLAPRQCCRPCEAWLRHDAKMLVTPRGRDATRGMAADNPLRLCGAVKAASATIKEKGPTRPAPRFHPLGRQALRGAPARLLSTSALCDIAW